MPWDAFSVFGAAGHDKLHKKSRKSRQKQENVSSIPAILGYSRFISSSFCSIA